MVERKNMKKKSFALHLLLHQGYFRDINNSESDKNQLLFYAISQTYLPLLNMFANLESDGINFKLGLTITPSLCTLLTDPVVQQSYIEWLDKLILLGEAEIKKHEGNPETQELAKEYLRTCKRNKRDFVETFNQDILSKFAYYAHKGNIELFASAATNCFLPHYIDLKEAIHAQVEAGLIAHKSFFNLAPEGFWLPNLGYTPGLEQILRSYGLNYAIIETHGLLFSTPPSKNGIFSPVRSENSFAFFGRDPYAEKEIMGDEGYIHNEIYRNEENDIGFESDIEELTAILAQNKERVSTGYKYFSKASENIEKKQYDIEKARQQADKDAQDFLAKKIDLLHKAAELSEEDEVSLVATFDASLFGEKWFEGIDWLERFFRHASKQEEINIENCSDLAKNQFTLQVVQPYHSAASGFGYGEDLVDSSNEWMVRYVHKSTERMIDLAQRFTDDTGLKARALNLAAKEILLAQASDWPSMLHNKNYPDFAREAFSQNVSSFATVFESLGSNNTSTEWLTNTERAHQIFPWINYRIFSKKK